MTPWTQVVELAREWRSRRQSGKGGSAFDDVGRDALYAFRSMRKSPAFTLVAIVTIALGIGAPTAIFGLADSILLRPLPVTDPDRLVIVRERRSGAVSQIRGHMAMPFDRYEAYEEAVQGTFSGLAAERYIDAALRTDVETRVVNGALVSDNYFEVLGLRPALGRGFVRPDEPVVVIAYDLWARLFGEDVSAVGRTVYINSRPYAIAGVAPKGFHGTSATSDVGVWIPFRSYDPGEGARWSADWVVAFGRLRPGVDAAQAEAAVNTIAQRIPPEAASTTIRGARLEPLTGMPRSGRAAMARFLGMLLGTAVLVMLIAGANVAGMLLTKAVGRRREVAVRQALGAKRGRLMRQLLTEGLVLSSIGGVVGILLAIWGKRFLAAFLLPTAEHLALDTVPDLRMLGFALALTVGTGLLFSMGPAIRLSRTGIAPELREGANSAAGSSVRMRKAFVAAQVGLSVVLLVSAGLFVRSLRNTLGVDPGFVPEGVAVASVNLAPHGYDEARGRLFFRQLLTAVTALPGVSSAALSNVVLLSGSRHQSDVSADDPGGSGRVETSSLIGVVSPAYFETMGIRIVAGRAFTAADRTGAAPVVIINETLARRLWGDRNALGSYLRRGEQAYEVVGIVRDGKYVALTEPPFAFAFFPFSQSYSAGMTLHVRSRGNMAGTIAAIRDAVRAIDPNVAVTDVMPLPALIGSSVTSQRFIAFLVGIFGMIGLILAAVGIYGVIGFDVELRARDIGIRLALGARVREVLWSTVRRGILLAAAGAACGLLLALPATRLIEGYLFGVSPLDPLTLVGVVASLVLVAAVASWIPARRRAMRVDPIVALRTE
ncbi:MAG TPA: ABC transporter permease [Longimicrobiales bacterium]